MLAFGIAALVIAIVSIFIPMVGAFLAGLSGILAFFSAGRGTALGLSAVIINIINICFMSPSLLMIASHEAGSSGGNEGSAAFIMLLLIQVIAIIVFVGKGFYSRSKSQHSAG